MESFELAAGEAYERAQVTHPTLHKSLGRQYQSWSELAKNSDTVRGWEDDQIGGRNTTALLAKTYFLSEEVLAAGDVSCTALYPALYFADVPAASDGEKVKADMSQRAVGLMVVTEAFVTAIVRVGPGWGDLNWERSLVKNPRFILLGGMLVNPKYWCLQFDCDGEADTLCVGRGLTKTSQQAVADHILSALRA